MPLLYVDLITYAYHRLDLGYLYICEMRKTAIIPTEVLDMEAVVSELSHPLLYGLKNYDVFKIEYCQISNIRCTKSQNLHDSRLIF